jgi:hypothetical protein
MCEAYDMAGWNESTPCRYVENRTSTWKGPKMKWVARATEDEMVLSFLRAERASLRWGNSVASGIAGRWNLLDHPDLENETENEVRRSILAYRGYRLDTFLFAGFPDDVSWSRVRLTRSEVGELLVGLGQWDDLTERSRKVSIAARNARTIVSSEDPRINEAVMAIIEADRQGHSFEPLIIGGLSEDSPNVLIEGYARATAHASTPQGSDVEALSGLSPNFTHWRFWGLN